MQFHTAKKKKAIINITSLIDVLFLLLIFFMVSSTFREQPGMKLDLPETKSHEVTETKDSILQIVKDKAGTESLILNAQEIPIDSLAPRLTALLKNTEDKSLTLKADKKIEHGLVVKAMDIARQCGVKKLIVATKIDNQ